MDREFRRGLEDCLGRLARGEDVRSCLDAYPRHAERLEPYLRSAETLRNLEAPRPASGARRAARERLMSAVASGGRQAAGVGPAWLPAPLLRAATVAAALFMFMVAAIGASAALGGGDVVHDVFKALHLPSPIGEDGDDTVELEGRVISVSRFGLGLRTADGDILFVWYSEDTGFEVDGEEGTWADVSAGADAFVRAMPRERENHFDALFVRIGESPAMPTPMPKPEPTATPKPEPTATPKPTEQPQPPAEETPVVVWTEVAFEGKIKSVSDGSFTLLSGDALRTFEVNGETEVVGYLAAYVFADVTGWQREDGSFLAGHVTTYPLEFWAAVVSVSSGSMTVKVENAGPNVVVYTNAETKFAGTPFAGVKVWITAYKKADGSYVAKQVTVKTAEIYGAVTAKSGGTYTVFSSGVSYTVTTNGSTVFVGTPTVGSVVVAGVYKMADGSFLAYKITVKEGVYSGVITQIGPAANTIYVNVGGSVWEVCTEFAAIYGTLTVGATVEVHVDHIEVSTYFAALVKVTG